MKKCPREPPGNYIILQRLTRALGRGMIMIMVMTIPIIRVMIVVMVIIMIIPQATRARIEQLVRETKQWQRSKFRGGRAKLLSSQEGKASSEERRLAKSWSDMKHKYFVAEEDLQLLEDVPGAAGFFDVAACKSPIQRLVEEMQKWQAKVGEK